MSFEKSKVKIEMGADRDVRKAIEALQDAFDDCVKFEGVSAAGLARDLSVDASALSRILNGKNQNVKLRTLAKIFRALEKRMEVSFVDLSSIPAHCQNARKLVEVEHVWRPEWTKPAPAKLQASGEVRREQGSFRQESPALKLTVKTREAHA